jgi:hypothetical protein
MVIKKKTSSLDIHKNYVQPDPYANYIDNLQVFHTDTMELLRYIDFHWVGTDNRLATKAKIKALIKQGKEIEV